MTVKQLMICVSAVAFLWSGNALSAKKEAETVATGPCQYTVMQEIVRNARDHQQIFQLIEEGVLMDDPTITCGGNLLQLAIRRGNPNIVNGILSQKPTRANETVSLKGFEIPEAPETVPVLLFAAYYAPSPAVFQIFLDRNVPMTVADSKGHNVLWYLDQNPVLRQTSLTDQVQALLQKQLLKEVREKSRAELDALAKERLATGEGTVTINSNEQDIPEDITENPEADTLAMP